VLTTNIPSLSREGSWGGIGFLSDGFCLLSNVFKKHLSSMKPKKLRSILTALLLFTLLSTHAQPDGDDQPPTGGGPGCCDENPDGQPDENIPFDGGISLMLAAGIGYGMKKSYDRRMKYRKP
jgi:hypothetical protein